MLNNTPDNFDKSPPQEGPRAPLSEPPPGLSMPPVPRVEEVRGESGLIRMEYPAAGEGSRGSLVVIVSGPNGDEAARFALSPPPDAAALSAIGERIEAARMSRLGPRQPEAWYRESLKKLAEYGAQGDSARFARLPDSRDHRLAPVPPMTPSVMEFREYARCPDLPQRNVTCARAFGDNFLRLEAFIDPHSTGVYYSLRLITPEGNEHIFDGLLEQRLELTRLSSRRMLREVALQMQSFWEGNLEGMSVVGPIFRRWIGEKLNEEAGRVPGEDSVADVPSAQREEPVPEARALPSGATLRIEEEAKTLSLVARAAAQDGSSTCKWNAYAPQEAGERRAQIMAVFNECIGLLATQDSEKIARALAKLTKARAPLDFTRPSTANLVGAHYARVLHREGSLAVDMSDIPERDLVASTLAGDTMVRFDVPRIPRRAVIDDIYERLTIVHKADGALEADSMSAGKNRIVLRLLPDAVQGAGGAESVSRHLLSAFVSQDKTSGFAFERACKELVNPERDDRAWLLMYEDEFGRRPSVIGRLERVPLDDEFFVEDDL